MKRKLRVLFGRWMAFLAIVLLCHNLSHAQGIWSLSEKTGIKGVQLSVGSNLVLNKHYFENRFAVLLQQNELNDSNYFEYGGEKNGRSPSVQLEIVYAPFRFHANPTLRSMELLLGISGSGFTTHAFHIQKTNQSSDYFLEEKTSYSMYTTNTFLTIRANVHQRLSSRWMGYGSLGYGYGITSGEELYKRYTVFYNNNLKTNGNGETELYRSFVSEYWYRETLKQSSMYQQVRLGIGAKFYISCLWNVFAEYQLAYTNYHYSDSPDFNLLQQYIQIGFRLKFNPPEPENPDDEKKTPNAFW